MNSNQKSQANSNSGRQNNKKNSRSRNQNGRSRKGSSKKQPVQPLTANKQIDSHGPNGKVRGNVKQLYDKYKALAHECRTKDRTSSEAYGQYAHHYYTLYAEFAAADAAKELERENEKERKREAAAENQSNVVSLLEDDVNADDIIRNIYDDEEDEDNDKESMPKSVRKKRAKKLTSTDNIPELPLENNHENEKPKRAGRSKKVKEEVAE